MIEKISSKLVNTALTAVVEASKVIMKIYEEDFRRIEKEDGSPVTIADYTSSNILREHLEKTGLPITGEERKKAPFEERKKWDQCWCIDPLDGTKEFIKKNGEFVINIALLEGEKAVFGLIASPVQRKIILGGSKYGAYSFSFDDVDHTDRWKELKKLAPVRNPLTVISSRSHYTGDILSLIHRIEEHYNKFESIKMGSALKFFHLVKGKADIYPRFAPTMEWDIAAGHAIFNAVGGEIVALETGEPLVYNKMNLENPYFIAYNKHVPKSVVLDPSDRT
ncbi:MAG: 3'(2'),5'-bisphosphate nucleotidase CysQ family protein [Bacteroidota bacterium]